VTARELGNTNKIKEEATKNEELTVYITEDLGISLAAPGSIMVTEGRILYFHMFRTMSSSTFLRKSGKQP
jgi:hypothetical protein